MESYTDIQITASVKAFKDHNSRFYVSPDGKVLLTRDPRVKFAERWPKDLQQLPDEMVQRVVAGFLECADKYGGFSLAISILKEHVMSSKGNFLVILAGAVAANYAFEKEAQAAIADGGPQAGGKYLSEADWDKLPVAERCELARPMLSEKEKAKTQDGEGFAKSSWKVASRFKNAKPAGNATQGADGKPAKETKPRAKGVKTLIYEIFNGDDGDDKILSVDEIMKETNGTRASVTTAISDLRSSKYAGKQGTLNLVRVSVGTEYKYAKEGSTALKTATEAAATAAKEAEAQKAKDAEAKKKADADAKATEAAKAKETGATAGASA